MFMFTSVAAAAVPSNTIIIGENAVNIDHFIANPTAALAPLQADIEALLPVYVYTEGAKIFDVFYKNEVTQQVIDAQVKYLYDAQGNKTTVGVDDVAAAKTVEDAITALPAQVILTDKDAVVAARAAFTALTATQQALVTNISILEAAETAITQIEAAEAAVVAYETAPITTLAEITTAEGLKAPADTAVAAVTTIATKDAFTARITAKTTAIATKKVELTVLAVTSVSAINNKQILVTFSDAVDATAAATLANYTYTGVSTLTVAPVLQADKKSVLVTLTAFEAQQAKATLAIANMKSATGVVMATTTLNVTFLDTTVPTAVSANLTAPTKVQIKFSEPVNPVGLANALFALDSNSYSLGIAPVMVTGSVDTVEITLGSVLPAGSHTLVINPTGVVSPVMDYAGFVVPTTTLTFTYAVDIVAPTAVLTSLTQKQAVITFNKPVSVLGVLDTDFTVYHSFNNQASYKGTSSLSLDGLTLTVNFTAPMLPGNVTLYLNNSATATLQLQDGWANKFATTTLNGTVAADTTAPSILTATKYDSTHIDITFSEAVNGATASAFTVKNAAGTANVVTSAVVTTGNTYRVTLTTAMNGDTYTLSIPAATIYDNAVVVNYLPAYATAFTVADTSVPSVNPLVITDASGAFGTKIKVSFTKAMALTGTGSILDSSNYIWSGGAFPTGTTITSVDSGKAALITFPAAGTLVDTYITVGRVADSLGNFITLFSSEPLLVVAGTVEVANFANPKAITTNVATVEINQPLTAINAGLFTIDAKFVTSATYVNQLLSDGVTNGALITLTVSTAWATTTTTTTPVIAITAANAVTTSFGTKNEAAFEVGIAVDKMAPSLTTAIVTNPTTLTLTYSEAIKVTSIGMYTYTVAGNTVTAVAGAGTNVITLTLGTELTGTYATASVTQALAIQDDLGVFANTLAASTTAFTATDGLAPAVTGVIEGGFYQTASPTFTEGTATLNNSPYIGGTPIAGDSQQTLAVTDAASNVTTVNFTTDNTAPTAPTVDILDGALYDANGVTPTISSAPIDATQTVTLDGLAYAGGAITTDGAHMLVITNTDAAGNASAITVSFTVDAAVPATPLAGNITIADNTSTTVDTISGSAGAVEGGATVNVYSDIALTTLVGSATAAADGSFALINLTNATTGIITYYVVAVDVAGNVSVATSVSYSPTK